jgi:hypothetical protein
MIIVGLSNLSPRKVKKKKKWPNRATIETLFSSLLQPSLPWNKNTLLGVI